MPRAQLNGRGLYYERRGDGPPLLLIQGMAGHHRTWGEPFLTALARDFDVVAYDHRGIGESDDVAGDFTIGDLADDAAALLDDLGWTSAHVLGVSLGGMVAQELALQHASRVRTLVLGCTYPGGEGASLRAAGPIRMMTAMNTRDVEQAVRAAYVSNLSAGHIADERHYAAFHEMALSVAAPVPVILRQAKAAFAHDAGDRLAGIAVPTLVLHGDEDDMMEHLNAEVIAAAVPGARLVTFEHTGHMFWWEHPERAAALIREHCCGTPESSGRFVRG
ncbi:MAG: alpha/beta fold hydrolase [Jatrophihabitans sp.]|uniref:alpha/beta fold hydrolase n=1 Tax=Jatrophihabitans sp. TaxID=1932789 RepID=UPI003F7EED56